MKRQILVIDDSTKIHPLIGAILASEPVEITYAIDAEYGKVLAQSLRPDLILLDVDMPGIDGFEACRQLKADAATADCPIIFLTSHADVQEKVRGFNLGAVDYVTKPFNADELRARVRASLKTRTVIRTLEKTALVDSATGLGNQQMFDQRLAAEIGLHARSLIPLSIVVMQAPVLRSPTAGISTGAAGSLLKGIGELVRDTCRAEDVPCRLNDLLVIIAPQTPASDAEKLGREIAERIAAALGKLSGRHPGVLSESLTAVPRYAVAQSTSPYDRTMFERARAALAAPAPAMTTRRTSAFAS